MIKRFARARLAVPGAFFLALLSLAGCSKPAPPTADSVVSALTAAGAGLADIKRPERDPTSPMPNSYSERVTFSLPSVAPRGGQVLVCSKREHCDALFAYFDALKALAGPYLYRSNDGLVVAQLNSSLDPQAAEKIGEAIRAMGN